MSAAMTDDRERSREVQPSNHTGHFSSRTSLVASDFGVDSFATARASAVPRVAIINAINIDIFLSPEILSPVEPGYFSFKEAGVLP
jgi:hypothetical protein